MSMSNRNGTHEIIVSFVKNLANAGIIRIILQTIFLVVLLVPVGVVYCHAETLNIRELIREAIQNNPELAAMKSKASASTHRAPQAQSLPDPMFMVGYQNDGTRSYSYGEKDSQWMFTASQMFPYPGKLGLKSEMAEKESQSQFFQAEMAEITLIQKIREQYIDFSTAYKELEIVRAKRTIYEKVEETTLARYASGMGMQQEVLMAQTEKYMLSENEEMLKAKISSIEAMLSASIGRKSGEPIGKPEEIIQSVFELSENDAQKKAEDASPEIKAMLKMSEASKANLDMAHKEYYPDVTLSAGYALKGGDNEDMVNFSATANIPLFFRTKQREGVYEAAKGFEESRHTIEATKLMISSRIRDNYAMLKSGNNLVDLYKNAIIPKSRQDFEQALAGFSTGRAEALLVLERLRRFKDSETALWKNIGEREKAIARIEALSAIAVPEKFMK